MIGRDSYIAQNLRDDNNIYIAPPSQDSNEPWLIESVWKGDQILKKMVAKLILPPNLKPDLFEKIRINKTDLGDVHVFKLKE